ncbi:muq1p [Saccharomyces arboricola H-6]|uniref:ethanolamine-phosphate cytidylyltransferase n=1 Tax=Saccharomyces arboricola (strain H-6 / AS 2.3317 / CBS 10644) TaxID=1160507 RepID=J8Q238_SACAR|nr:muq1p [Saccharomyces arboricola H-6]
MTIILDPDKVWIDGCFDFTHHGHAGAILQARQTVSKENGKLFCGVHTDEDIQHHKGSPVMNSKERYEHTKSNRWCSEVVEAAPYVTDPDWMDRYQCQYVVHGDDITLDASGEDCYKLVKEMGRFKVVKRTQGVSTTEIIHRILTKRSWPPTHPDYYPNVEELASYSVAEDAVSKYCYVFERDLRNTLVGGGYDFKVKDCVYVDGDFDLFHMGDIDQLRKLKMDLHPDKRLVIGITTSDYSNTIMTMKERVLSVLSCKYVDAVIIDADTDALALYSWEKYHIGTAILKAGGTFSEYLTKNVIIKRVESQREVYIARNQKKGMSI